MEGIQKRQTLESIVRKKLFANVFVPLILLSILANLIYFALAYKQFRRQHIILTTIGIGFLQEHINSICRLLASISGQSAEGDIEGYLYTNKFLEFQQVLRNVIIYDPANDRASRIYPVYSARVYGLPAVNHFSRLVKSRGLDGVCYVSPPYYSPYSGSVTVAFASRNGSDIVIGEAKLEQMLKINVLSHAFKDTLLFITDRFGNVIVHPDIKLVERRENFAHEAWFRSAKKDPRGVHIAIHQGRWYIIAGLTDAFSGWWCFAATPLSSILLPYLKMQLIILFACVTFCTAIFYLTRRWLLKTVVQPVENLAREVRSMTSTREDLLERVGEGESRYSSISEIDICFRTIASTVERLTLQEQALAESEERFRAIAEHAPVALGIFQDNVFIYSNTEAQRLTGYTPEELQNIEVWELVHPDYREQVKERILIRQTMKAAPIHYDALPVVVKDGDMKWFRVSVGSVEVSGRPAGLLVAVDVTSQVLAVREKFEYEKKFRHMQRLEAVGVLAGGIAHEFNNLLHGIVLNVDILKSRLRDRPEFKDYLENLYHLTRRGSKLVRGLLTYSRKQRADREIVSAHDEIRRIMTISRASFPKNIALEEHLDAEDDRIVAETGQVEQIVMNLVSNAKDAIGDRSGRIAVKTRRIFLDRPQTFGLSTQGFYLRIDVEDDGPGMAPHVKERIFDPFFTTKEVGRGTGLGLSVILGIVESLGGRIFCESEVGRGTTFTVLLPSAEKEATEKTEKDKEDREEGTSHETKPLSLLMIDDEEIFGSLVKEFFEQKGHKVHYYPRAESALEFLENSEEKPDLIILDLGLPGMGGRECLNILKTKYPDIPVIVASGYISHDVIKNYRAYGASACLSKPFTVDKLLETIREILPAFKG
ncbi:hybrid sensor histidine kinase/response regulator [Thermodesulforhabdus norvegica]|uniref:histidine kinase n=1 Tax=Thermodesulforhabdus norvegica TaxID=39841 RepID=A0A1I4W5I9_9BACT|nr:PAS domain S-box protein [Thermodesulforhabdus norvegica]SFN08954.1 PAS domain S-box-containing protein [Thermodesulforhabdus norvegica]